MSMIRSHKATWAEHRRQQRGRVEATTTVPVGADPEYEVWRAQVLHDKQHLRSTYQDHAERNKRKPALLDKYREYLQGWMQTGATHQNDVLVNCCIWAADCGEFAWAVELADYGKGQVSGMARDLRTFVADAVRIQSADAEQAAMLENGSVQPFELVEAFFDVLDRINDGRWKVSPTTRSKNFRMAGLWAEGQRDWEAAIACYTEANKDPSRGVKGRLANAHKQFKLTATGGTMEAPPPQAGGADDGGMGGVSPDQPSADATA